MAARRADPPRYDDPITWPALFVAFDWIERHCIVPDGDHEGAPFLLDSWQAWFVLNHYRVKPKARPGQRATAFHNRRSQLVLPQKAGKGPMTAAQSCLEGVGPALFHDWAGRSDEYRCSDHGCPCGWVYRYAKGEAMGRPWPTPLIQITATAKAQTDNIYGALKPMIDEGPLHRVIPKTSVDFIRLPGNGRIDAVTSEARSKLGQRVTFAPQDETGLYTVSNGMKAVADTQRRGLAGMGGRAVETTNGWDPTEHSTAQDTAEATTGDIFRIHPLAPEGLDYMKRDEREQIHLFVYAGSPWVDLDGINAEAEELVARDPGQAERFFGNRIVAGAGKAFDIDRWNDLARPRHVVEEKTTITIGVDGARFHDALAGIATEVATGFQWPLFIITEPDKPPDGYEHDFELADAAMLNAFDEFNVARVYIDPQYIDVLVARWQGRWGKQIVHEWFTFRDRPVGFAVRNYTDGIASGEITHDGDETFAEHIGNAVKRRLNAKDDDGNHLHTLSKPKDKRRKIDAAMAGVISDEARRDAIADGVLDKPADDTAMHW